MNRPTRIWIPAFLSTFLASICFFPANLGLVAWVALVPWLTLVVADRPRSRGIYAACFLGSLAFHLAAIQWIRVAHPAMYASWGVLAFICATVTCLSLWTARRLTRLGVPFWLAAAIAIVAFDYARAHFPTGYPFLDSFNYRHPIGFAWYYLGHSQHDYLAIIQLADVTGVYGITFVIVVCNGILFGLLSRSSAFRSAFRLPDTTPTVRPAGVLLALTLLLGTVVYGFQRLRHAPFEEGPEVALLQGNIPQDLKNDRGEEMVSHFEALCDQAVNPPAGIPKPEFVVWPETGFAWVWHDIPKGVNDAKLPSVFARNARFGKLLFRENAERWPVAMLYGMNRMEWESPERTWKYNSAILADSQGKFVASYDKIHLVPFGEYIPMVETFPFMKAFTPYEGDYSCRPGQSFTKMTLTTKGMKFTFGTLICYEDTDPGLARQYVGGPEPVDFLVNISNDGWFDGTAEHEQHLAIARFRAVETRRALIRSVNMGVSAIIDPDGRVVALPSDRWSTSKKMSAIVRGRIPLGEQQSLYAVLGDWVPLTAWMFIFMYFGWKLIRRAPKSS